MQAALPYTIFGLVTLLAPVLGSTQTTIEGHNKRGVAGLKNGELGDKGDNADAKKIRSLLVGQWRSEVVNGVQSIKHLRADGTYTGRLSKDDSVVWEYAGKWSFDGTHLQYEYTQSSLERIPPGTRDADEIEEVTDEYYIYTNRAGNRRRCTRVRE